LDKVSAENVIPMDRMLRATPRMDVSESDETKVAHGNPFRAEGSAPLARIFNKKGEFIAIASVENGWARPRLVLTSITSR
jgi:tRNA U55 pseudouridine synthase TruB